MIFIGLKSIDKNEKNIKDFRIYREKMPRYNKKEKDYILLKKNFENFIEKNNEFFCINRYSNEKIKIGEIEEEKKFFLNNYNSPNPKLNSNFEKNKKEKVKMDIYSLKKIKNLNIFEDDNPYNTEKKLDNIYGIFSNMNNLKKYQKMKILYPDLYKESYLNNLMIKDDNNNKNNNIVLINIESFTIPRTVKVYDYNKGFI